jgi:hypothetical protein
VNIAHGRAARHLRCRPRPMHVQSAAATVAAAPGAGTAGSPPGVSRIQLA